MSVAEDVDEISTSAGAGAYLTKYAFKKPKKFGTGKLSKNYLNNKVRVRFDGNFVGTFRADRVKPVMDR